MTKKDAPYVAIIVIFMVTMFFAGRLSVSGQATQTSIPAPPASAAIAVSMPVAEQGADQSRVLPAEALPTVVTLDVAHEKTKPASKPAETKQAATSSATPVAPLKIELEDDPSAIANPYKIPKTVASTPGF